LVLIIQLIVGEVHRFARRQWPVGVDDGSGHTSRWLTPTGQWALVAVWIV
jgi:hypothetical protein